ncbi:acetyl-CoA carboxylase biotin carboxyl carrier protein [Ferviditalea candida]|uniref:Biotin carboxyl carrier protein of acetyl-CoA carboxylase n=1 Tax=Ferviditalea candida TaxID=3108399 RepID=A0ABU5ZFV2_9BACL|nr:biotin/lipoyl-containing protein [Paenibacillaceae bacterium T2]
MNERDELTYEDLLQIIRIIDSSANCTYFHLKLGDIDIEIEKRDESAGPMRNRTDADAASSGKMSEACAASAERTEPPRKGTVSGESKTAEAAEQTADETVTPLLPEEGFKVKAPMVGLFYRCPEPGAPPFVEVGQRVSKEDTVCLIEVMKLFTSIKAGCDGIVSQILAEDGLPVEYGQTLIVIEPKVDED